MTKPLEHSPAYSFSLEQIVDLTGLGRTSVYQAIRDRKLTARKVGRRTIVLKADLEAFLSGLENAR